MPESEWHTLVVEDEEDSVLVVSTILRHHGINVTVAHDGYECLTLLQQYHPTLVVMDLNMPGLDGWATLVEMRTNPATAHIPVVAITAYHSANVAQDAMLAGFDAYFPKPIDAASFVSKLESIMS